MRQSLPEELDQIALCEYLRLQYPDVLFNSDLSGIRLTPGQAKKVKKLRSERAWPDMFIAEPRGGFCGLYIELKAEDVKLLKKDGTLRSHKQAVYAKVGGQRVKVSEMDHHKEQYEMLVKLKEKGYKAVFAVGFEQAKKVIDEYLKME